jgi:hypothetical protein
LRVSLAASRLLNREPDDGNNNVIADLDVLTLT